MFRKKTVVLLLIVLLVSVMGASIIYAKTPAKIKVNKSVRNKPAYYFNYDKDKSVTKNIDLNDDKKWELINFKPMGSDYIKISINGKRVLSKVKIRYAALIDFNNKDKYIELFITTEKGLNIYRYKGKKLTIYAKGDNNIKTCPLDSCPIQAGYSAKYTWICGGQNPIPSKKYFTGAGTVKINTFIDYAAVWEPVPGIPNVGEFYSLFRGNIIYYIKNGKLIGDRDRIYNNNKINPYNKNVETVKISDVFYTVEKIKFSKEYLYLSCRNVSTGEMSTKALEAKAGGRVRYSYYPWK